MRKHEPEHDNTKEIAANKVSDQPGHPPSWSVFAVRSRGSQGPNASSCGQPKHPGWYESSLGAQVILLVLSCSGSNTNPHERTNSQLTPLSEILIIIFTSLYWSDKRMYCIKILGHLIILVFKVLREQNVKTTAGVATLTAAHRVLLGTSSACTLKRLETETECY